MQHYSHPSVCGEVPGPVDVRVPTQCLLGTGTHAMGELGQQPLLCPEYGFYLNITVGGDLFLFPSPYLFVFLKFSKIIDYYCWNETHLPVRGSIPDYTEA